MIVLINSGNSLIDLAITEMLLENGHNAFVWNDTKHEDFVPDVVLVSIKTVGECDRNSYAGLVVLALDLDPNRSSDLTEALLTHRIHGVLPGEMHFSNFQGAVIDAIREGRKRMREKARSIIATLSERDAQIATFVCQGCSNKEIADRLSISPRAVTVRLNSIFKKFRTKNCSSLVPLIIGASRPASEDTTRRRIP